MSNRDSRLPVTSAPPVDVDTIIVGAGFGGLRALHEMRQKGHSVQLIEAGSDVGGTWYWNRYPGARTDSEAWAYCFSFSKELQDEWDWAERMPTWDQVQQYLAYVADKFDMRRDIAFDTKVNSAVYDGASRQWVITTECGKTWRCTYFITAVGWFSIACTPPFAGLDQFKGQWMLSSAWPKEPVDFTNKRVGIVGSGSTAVQILPLAAKLAKHVKVFQRTPNYVLPGRNHPLDDTDRASIRANYDDIWAQVRQQVFAFPMTSSTLTYDDVQDEAERQRIFEAGWEAGGFRFLFETFADLLVDQRSNDAASEFVRNKIRALVKDPATAELMCPKYPIALKRPPLGNFYYESFNRDNVQLVDVSEHPILEATSNGLKTALEEHELDIIIFAIGFDAVTGSLTQMDVRGRDGVTIRDKWAAGPRTHLGIAVDGFPNMFMITGPQTPFSNVPPVVEEAVKWIGQAISHMQNANAAAMEPEPAAVQGWVDHIQAMLDATLLGQGAELKTWFMGANVPGKAHAPLHYFGGAAGYFAEVEQSAAQGFPGFVLETA